MKDTSSSPLRLTDLTWTRVAAHLRRDSRLLVPVGVTLQHGPHLPLGTDTIIVTELAEAVSAGRRVLLAPTLPYGAGSPDDRAYAGTACLTGKTLHRTLNELVVGWEQHGVEEFVLLTAHGYGPHLQALATVVSDIARVRAVDVHAIDLSDFLETWPSREHAGELATSLLLHLAPDLVDTAAIEDLVLEPSEVDRLLEGEEPSPRPGSSGVVGRPSAASAEKGRRIFEHMVGFVGERVFAAEEGHATPHRHA